MRDPTAAGSQTFSHPFICSACWAFPGIGVVVAWGLLERSDWQGTPSATADQAAPAQLEGPARLSSSSHPGSRPSAPTSSSNGGSPSSLDFWEPGKIGSREPLRCSWALSQGLVQASSAPWGSLLPEVSRNNNSVRRASGQRLPKLDGSFGSHGIPFLFGFSCVLLPTHVPTACNSVVSPVPPPGPVESLL